MRSILVDLSTCKCWEINVKKFFTLRLPKFLCSKLKLRFDDCKSLISYKAFEVLLLSPQERIIHFLENFCAFCIEIMNIKVWIILLHHSHSGWCIRFIEKYAANVSGCLNSSTFSCFNLISNFFFHILHVLFELMVLGLYLLELIIVM